MWTPTGRVTEPGWPAWTAGSALGRLDGAARARRGGTMLRRLLCTALVAITWTAPAGGYIDAAPTLGSLVQDSTNIVVLQVDRVSREKGVIIFRTVAELK